MLQGAVSGDAKSNINHPAVKLFLVAVHLLMATMLILTRRVAGAFPATTLWIVFWAVFTIQRLDLRRDYRSRFVRTAFWSTLLATAPLFLANQNVVDVGDMFGWLQPIIAYVTGEDLIIFLFGIGAAIAAARIYSLDALWLSSRLPPALSVIVIPTMVTYFACRRFLIESIRDIFDAASFKAKLVRSRGITQRLTSYTGSVATQIIPRFKEIASAIQATLRERELVGERRRAVASITVTAEDYLAVTMVGGILVYAALVLGQRIWWS